MAESQSQIFRVLPKQADQTIGAALREWLRGKSWSEVRGLLKTRRVMLSGNLCVDPARRLKLQDVVKILPHPSAPLPKEIDVRIVFMDPHVVVVEKPAGMTSLRHSEERHWPSRRRQVQPTLDEVLPRIIAKKERSGHKRPGSLSKVRAVHRLDRETSGLMVFARTVEAERHLVQQFRRHATHRRYMAIACGPVEVADHREPPGPRPGRRPARGHDVAGRRQTCRHPRAAAGEIGTLHAHRVPPGDRPHAPESASIWPSWGIRCAARRSTTSRSAASRLRT